MQGSPRIDELRQKFHENPRRYFAPLANEYRKAGDPEQAIAICRAHLAQQPAHMSGHVVYGQALHDAGRTDEARTVFEKALSLDPDNSVVLRGLGNIARERGETTEARHWYTRALDLDPQDTEIAAYVAELAEPLTEQPVAEPAPVATESPPELPAEDPVSEEPVQPAAEVSVSDQPAEKEAEAPPGESTVVMSDARELEPEPPPAAPPEAPPDEDALWRKTPVPEASPFVTRTMAELYARQGHDAAALDVYRQLALRHPEDESIRARIRDLAEQEPPADAAGDAVDAASDILSDEPIFTPAAETTVDASQEPGRHFTETDLFTDDAWTADVWSPGLMSHEALDAGSEATDTAEAGDPDVASEAAPAEIVAGEAVSEQLVDEEIAAEEIAAEEIASEEIAPEEVVAEATSGETIVAEEAAESTAVDIAAEAVADDDGMSPDTVLQGDEAAQAMISQPTAELVADSTPAESLDALATAETGEEWGEESGVVAYSPEPPADEDLPHFTLKGPTIREFFATLGARKPEPHEERSFTARASIPTGEPAPAEDLPLATDAFASLFPDSTVTEEDTRAAFALSGALSSTAHAPVPPRVQTSPPQPSPAVQETGEESEEDIRRFREWLDGLSES